MLNSWRAYTPVRASQQLILPFGSRSDASLCILSPWVPRGLRTEGRLLVVANYKEVMLKDGHQMQCLFLYLDPP